MSVSAPRHGPLHRAARWLLYRLGAAPPAPPHQPSPQLQGETLRRYTRLALVTRRQAPSGAGGDHRGRARTPSHDFVDYRQYQPGDDVRRVDWNVYGRLGTLHVRLTEAHEPLELVLALDCSASMRWGEPDKLDYAARLASALATIALAHGDAVRLVLATHPELPEGVEAARRSVRYGASPRGAQAMILAGKIHALLAGRLNVSFDDVRRVAPAALRHRVLLSYEAEAKGTSPDSLVSEVLAAVTEQS